MNALKTLNQTIDFLLTFFLIVGGAGFLVYAISSQKLFYIPFIFLTYAASLLIRKYIFKPNTKAFTSEFSYFLFASLFVGYIIYYLNLDKEIGNYLPNALLLKVGSSFIYLLLASLITSENKTYKNKILHIILIICLFALVLFQGQVNEIWAANEFITNAIIGTPFLFLFKKLL